jgi:hypothetical protein
MKQSAFDILRDLGTYGWDDNEESILAMLFNTDPLLIIGGRGSTKTQTLKRVSTLVLPEEYADEWFHAYSAPNDNFEDVIGIFDPEELKNKKLDYITSGISIWEKRFVLFGELNRAKPEIQGKYLQVILERKVMGKPTKVTWVCADMNPLGYAGTKVLDQAMADRFSLLLTAPNLYDLKEDDQEAAIQNYGDAAMLGLKQWDEDLRNKIMYTESFTPQSHARAKEKFADLKKELVSNGLWYQVYETYRKPAAKYLSQITNLLNTKAKAAAKDSKQDVSTIQETIPSGRRMSMMHRSIITRIAIRMAFFEGSNLSGEEVAAIASDTFSKSLIHPSTGMDFNIKDYDTSHLVAKSTLMDVKGYWHYKIETEKNPAKKVAMAILYKKDDAAYVATKIEEASRVTDEKSKWGQFYNLTELPIPGGFNEVEVVKKFITPTIVSLLLGNLIDGENLVIPQPVRAACCAVNSSAINLLAHQIKKESWLCRSDIIADAYSKENATFEAVIANQPENARAYWQVAHYIFGTVIQSLNQVSGDDSVEKYWADEILKLGEAIRNNVQEVMDILIPLMRYIQFESGINVGYSKLEIEAQKSRLERVLRGLPVNTEKTKDEELAEAQREIERLRKQLAEGKIGGTVDTVEPEVKNWETPALLSEEEFSNG